MTHNKIDIYNEVDNFVEENEGEVTNTEIARHFLELGRNNAIIFVNIQYFLTQNNNLWKQQF